MTAKRPPVLCGMTHVQGEYNLWSTPNPLKVSTVCRKPGTAWLGSLADPAFGVLSRWEIGFIHSIGRSVLAPPHS